MIIALLSSIDFHHERRRVPPPVPEITMYFDNSQLIDKIQKQIINGIGIGFLVLQEQSF